MKTDERLRRLTVTLTRHLPALCQRLRGSTDYSSVAVRTGEFRSRRVIVRGIERAEPRAFTLDDDPLVIDVNRLPPLVADDFAGCLLRGELRAIQSVRVTESEFVVIADLSRSTLAGLFAAEDDSRTSDLRDPSPAQLLSAKPSAYSDAGKLCGLFFCVASFLHLASTVGFRLRTICAHGDQAIEDRTRISHDLMDATLSRMGTLLVQTCRQGMAAPASREPFSLTAGLRTALSVHVRGAVLIVSDFLDPVLDYAVALRELMARHYVILADVAVPSELTFPVPGYLNLSATRMPVHEGARHLEHGLTASPITRQKVVAWNAEQHRNRAQLKALSARGGALHLNLYGKTFAQSFETALGCFRHMH